jgi:hypothetical protein
MSAMKLSLLDRSNYYRGLLVLTRRDQVIHPRERQLMLEFGRILDFDKRFCEAAIDDLLRNPHIKNEPVTFSNPKTAECFLRDGIRLALVDKNISPKELGWLRSVARANGRTDSWLDAEVQRLGLSEETHELLDLEIQHHLA